jgi:hypothetical protein
MSALVAQLLFGWLLADLLGGIIHWWEDRAAERHWPIIGRFVVAPNREHHRNPSAIIRSPFIARNLATVLAAGALSLIWLALLGPSPIWAAASIGGLIQNQVHYWAHGHAPAWVRVLQETGLLQSSRQHGEHHRYETRRYCVLTNFLNPVLDALGIWAALEACLAALRIPVNGRAR